MQTGTATSTPSWINVLAHAARRALWFIVLRPPATASIPLFSARSASASPARWWQLIAIDRNFLRLLSALVVDVAIDALVYLVLLASAVTVRASIVPELRSAQSSPIMTAFLATLADAIVLAALLLFTIRLALATKSVCEHVLSPES